MDSEFEASFTGDRDLLTRQCGGSRCGNRCFKDCSPEEQAQWMVFKNRLNTSADHYRWVCHTCKSHYMSKSTTRRRDDSSTPARSQAQMQQPLAVEAVRCNIAAAQRGQGRATVQAVGTLRKSDEFFPLVNIHGRTNSSRRSGSGTVSSSCGSGYTANHSNFASELKKWRVAATAIGSQTEVVTIKVMMGRVVPKQTKISIIGACLKGLSNIDAHIGASELKAMAWKKLQPLWLQWSHGYQLSVDQMKLRHQKGFLEITNEPDAIYSFYWKQKSNMKVPKFDPKVDLSLFLVVEAGDFESADFHRMNTTEDNELSATQSIPIRSVTVPCTNLSFTSNIAPTNTFHQPAPGPSQSAGKQEFAIAKQRKRNRSDSMDFEVDATSSSQSKRAGPSAIFTPFKRGEIEAALREQKRPSTHSVATIFKSKWFDCIFYEIPACTLEEINPSQIPKLDFNYLAQYSGRLFVNLDIKHGFRGAFKTGHEGKVELYGDLLLPPFSDKTVCVKQLYTTALNGAIRRQRGATAATALMAECLCLYWATFLLNLTYTFIRNKDSDMQHPPPFEVPNLRFVRAMLAVVSDTSETVFLVEEWIDTSQDQFRKYINNGIATSCVHRSAPASAHNIADFLSFAQHVQWRETKYLAFTSDFQGGSRLLTDPQILTNPNLGKIFADGNIPAGFEEFQIWHTCNDYCQYYGLSIDDDLIILEQTSSENTGLPEHD